MDRLLLFIDCCSSQCVFGYLCTSLRAMCFWVYMKMDEYLVMNLSVMHGVYLPSNKKASSHNSRQPDHTPTSFQYLKSKPDFGHTGPPGSKHARVHQHVSRLVFCIEPAFKRNPFNIQRVDITIRKKTTFIKLTTVAKIFRNFEL